MGGLLLATVFPFVGLAVFATSVVTSFFLKKREGESTESEKKEREVKQQIVDVIKKLEDDLKDTVPKIIHERFSEIEKKIKIQINGKLDKLNGEITKIREQISKGGLREVSLQLSESHNKVIKALDAIGDRYAPANIHTSIVAITAASDVGIEIAMIGEPAAKDKNYLLPLFGNNELWLDTTTTRNHPIFNVTSSGLLRLPFFSKEEIEVQVINNLQQRRIFSLSGDETIKLINNLAINISIKNLAHLRQLVTISEKSEEKELLGGLVKYMESINGDQDIKSVKKIISAGDYSSDAIANKTAKIKHDCIEKKIIASTFWGTGRLFKELKEVVEALDHSSQNLLDSIAASLLIAVIEVTKNPPKSHDAASRVQAANDSLSYMKSCYSLFMDSVAKQSDEADSFFNKKSTISERKQQIIKQASTTINAISEKTNQIQTIIEKLSEDQTFAIQFVRNDLLVDFEQPLNSQNPEN